MRLWEVNQTECVQCFRFPALSVITDQVLPTKRKTVRTQHFSSPFNEVLSSPPDFGHQHGVKINLQAPLLCDQ